MQTWRRATVALFVLGSLLGAVCAAVSKDVEHWIAEVPGGRSAAQRVARDLGFSVHRQLPHLKNKYEFRKVGHSRESRDTSHEQHARNLGAHPEVSWAAHQKPLSRAKRDFISSSKTKRFLNGVYEADDIPNKKSLDGYSKSELNSKAAGIWNDPFWPQQWYLHDTRSRSNLPKLDLHIIPVWKQNITGRGVVVSVLDDGIEYTHPDLAKNYDARASIDLNDDDDDPAPRYDPTDENKHGTRCAGEISMMADNEVCGVGVAYKSRIGGIRMLDGRVTDSIEARALTHAMDYVDIYSSSWGPNDDGRTMEGPGRLATEAFETGAREGRNGKGVIYIWASGNGGAHGDDCQCDGYTTSIYTLSISSASQKRKSPWYSEHCASTLATTFSSGAYRDQKIATTDIHGKCTTDHTGTSASAPLAAGIMALVLEKNPDITWRDTQHLVAWTSEYAPLMNNHGWRQNGAGFRVNTRFGFGLLNAAAMVKMADPKTWKTVPEKFVCEENVEYNIPRRMSSGENLRLRIRTNGCRGEKNEVNYLEHLQIYLSMSYSRRGDLEIDFESPSGMKTALLRTRMNDMSSNGFEEWPFMSVHNWGERPSGEWKLHFSDRLGSDNRGEVTGIRLVMHGTREMPQHMASSGGQRPYNEQYNQEKNIRAPTQF